MDSDALLADERGLAASVSGLPKVRIVAFTVASAARVAPLFRLFRAVSPASMVEDAIAQMWEAVQMADFDAIPGIFDRLASLPEAGDPDSEVREYIALQAIGCCHGPVATVTTANPREDILKTIFQVHDVAREFDHQRGYADLTGPILALEVVAEHACYETLAKDPLSPLPIEELKRLCQPAMDAYVAAAPEVAAHRGWELAS
jgi:hypothetical protein